MTDDEIDAAVLRIRVGRSINNALFCDWLATSFKCPHCRVAASKYQKLIREGDIGISEDNEPLTKL